METDNSLLGAVAPAAGADRPGPCSSCDEDVFDRPGFLSDGPREAIDTQEKVYDRAESVSDRIQQVVDRALLLI